MKAHIVGGGFGGLAAAVCLIEHAKVSGADITIYEASTRTGGAFSLNGNAATGYVLPSGSLFDAEFRCAFELLSKIPSGSDGKVSVKDEFLAFNRKLPFADKAHIVDRQGRVVRHAPRYGLSLHDAFALLRLTKVDENDLDGRRIEEFLSQDFFRTEFWLLFSTIMGPLPQHSAMEFRRYMNRTLALFPDLYDMAHILRTPLNQYEALIKPLMAWLEPQGVNFLTRSTVRELGFSAMAEKITVDRLEYLRNGVVTEVAIGKEDIVLVTLGSQADDLAVGAANAAPVKINDGKSWALWKSLAQKSAAFGRPDVFFGPDAKAQSQWVSFTVTTDGTEFIDRMTALTGCSPGSGGLVTLRDSPWVVSFSIFHQPEVAAQPLGVRLWWGYGLHPERQGDYIKKPMDECTGTEILEEIVRQLKFEADLPAIMASSNCIPCDLPYANNIWIPRQRGDRPLAVPEGATNLGVIGQYAETPEDITFTIEYSARTAWQAVYELLEKGPAPPAVYQGQRDPKALLAAMAVIIFG